MSDASGIPGWDPAPVMYLKVWITSTIILAMAYGGVLYLALSHIPFLLKTSKNLSRCMRNCLLLYVTFMVTIGTIYTIKMSIFLTHNIFDPTIEWNNGLYVFRNDFLGRFCVILASWGANGLMLWRCLMLYQGISRLRRTALVGLIFCLALISFVAGLIFLCIKSFSDFTLTWVFISIAIFFSIITATVIALRILYYQASISETVELSSGIKSLFTMAMVICLESSALIVVINLLFLIVSIVRQNYSLIPMQLLVHVYVLSPLLIVYRVAHGEAVTMRPSEVMPVVPALRSDSQSQRPSNNEV